MAALPGGSMIDRQLHFKSLDEALRELDRLNQAEPNAQAFH